MKRQGIVGAAFAALGMCCLMVVVTSATLLNRNANSGTTQNTNMGGNTNHSGHMGGNSNSGGMMGAASADARFVMEAAMGGMMEVELGRVASERGMSDAVKQFGRRMVDDHTRANEELMQIASSKGMTPPAAMSGKMRSDMAKTAALSGDRFDREYAKMMVKDHKKTVALFQREAQRGQDADLKAFASKMLPALQEHLRMAQELEMRTKNGGRSGSMNMNTGM